LPLGDLTFGELLMNLDRLKQVIDWMATSPVRELELSERNRYLHLVKAKTGEVRQVASPPTAAERPSSGPPQPLAPPSLVAAPLYGVVHLSPSAGAPPFVEVGQAIRAGQSLCVIEAMKVFNTIEAECDGTVAEILVASGTEVTAGQPLLRLDVQGA
jgi:acetyl-CoA carboxylase biotin carboxyl carrier protein